MSKIFIIPAFFAISAVTFTILAVAHSQLSLAEKYTVLAVTSSIAFLICMVAVIDSEL